jgi:hypothetical protein
MQIITKSIFVSKTVWFNVLTALVAVLTTLLNEDFIIQYPWVVQVFAVVVGVANVFLRYLTTEPVHVLPIEEA